MKKNGWILLLLVIIGLLAGALVSRWLEKVPGLDFLTHTYRLSWAPAADLMVIDYQIHIGLRISLLSIVGAIAAVWVYRKM